MEEMSTMAISHEKSNHTNNGYAENYGPLLEYCEDLLLKEYLFSRVFPMMSFYKHTAAKYKREYYLFSIASIILNGIIPIVALLGAIFSFTSIIFISIAALSASSGILIFLTTFMSPREHWMENRVCLEKLKSAVDLYLLHLQDHDNSIEVNRSIFLEKIERIVHGEERWTDLVHEKLQ